MNVNPFRFGANTRSAQSRQEWVEKARRIEALGYDILNVPDHLADLPAPSPRSWLRLRRPLGCGSA